MTIKSVDVSINISDTFQAQSDFSTVLILDEFAEDSADKLNTGKYFTSDGTATGTAIRVKEYGSIDAVAVDFKTTSVVYEKANSAFAQRNVNRILVGRKDPTDTDITTALNAVKAENNNWYGLVTTYGALENTSEADNIEDVETIDAWVSSNNKLYAVQTKDTTVLTTATSDIASKLRDKKSDRTFVIYHPDYDATNKKFKTHADVAILALILTYRAGTTTLEDKFLNGVTISKGLTDDQLANIENKNCNVYIYDRNLGVFKGNTLASGRFVDTRIYADFLKDEVQTNIKALKVDKSNRGSKLSYTNLGLAELSSVLTILFERELTLGALTPFIKYVNGTPKVFRHIIRTVPVSQVPDNEKNARKYNYLDFEVRYSSEIGAVKINGTLLV